MSIRLLEYKQEDGKDMYLVEYPSKGQKWVFSFMIGGQYKEEKAALKYRYEQRTAPAVGPNQSDQVSAIATASHEDGIMFPSLAHQKLSAPDARESLKCICQQQHATSGEEVIACFLCSKKSHVRCVRAEGFSTQETKDWQCPFCRILHMDPFNPGVELLMFTTTPRNMLAPSSQDGNLSLRFNVQANILKEWQSKKMSVVVRCVGLGPRSLNVPKGPLWPREVTASVNSYKDVFKILPGKYGHVRREVPSKEISDMIKPNSNTLTISYRTEAPAGNAQTQPPRFLFGVIACEGKSKTDILALIRHLSVEDARQKDVALVQQAHEVFESLQSQELLIETKADFDIVNTRCPLSLWEICTPVRGVECEHLQCYDADAYIDVNIKTRNVEKRWQCPVCSKLVRPEDLIVDEFLSLGIRLARESLKIPSEDGLMKRFRLGAGADWEILADEELEGEGSEDEEEPKRRRTGDDQHTGTAAAADEIILD